SPYTHATAIYPLSLHDALPICYAAADQRRQRDLDAARRHPAWNYCHICDVGVDGPALAFVLRQPHFALPRSGDPRRPLLREYPRSEEHTSELQSRENLVCRLLL